MATLAHCVGGAVHVLDKEYEYYDDGQLRYAQDLLDAKFDRLYVFDRLGRITDAKSGAEARGGTDGAENIPYRQTYSYDAFNHLTARTSNHWVAGYYMSDTYTNDRNDAWTYDAAGNLLATTDHTNTFDAAGRTIKVEVASDSRTAQEFDGLGQVLHQRKEVYSPIPDSYYVASDLYLIRSSVLGGTVVTEANNIGGKARTFVYAGGALVATQSMSYSTALVAWNHREAAGASSRATDTSGALIISGAYGPGTEAAELDPVGANAGTSNPYYDPNIPPDDGSGSSSQPSPSFANPWQLSTSYSVDGGGLNAASRSSENLVYVLAAAGENWPRNEMRSNASSFGTEPCGLRGGTLNFSARLGRAFGRVI